MGTQGGGCVKISWTRTKGSKGEEGFFHSLNKIREKLGKGGSLGPSGNGKEEGGRVTDKAKVARG